MSLYYRTVCVEFVDLGNIRWFGAMEDNGDHFLGGGSVELIFYDYTTRKV